MPELTQTPPPETLYTFSLRQLIARIGYYGLLDQELLEIALRVHLKKDKERNSNKSL